ncbi:MAG: hypothetical protein SF029_09440 [bacterium]|nr:hypothetical protein [bacterium]
MNAVSDLIARWRGRLPLLLVLMLVVGNALFCAASVLPNWMAYDRLTQMRESQQAQLNATNTEAANEDDLTLYAARIDNASTELAQAASSFLTSDQVDDLFDRLYAYAEANHVMIANLQTQQSVQTSETLPYETRLFRLQVNGDAADLMRFVVQIREATVPGVMIDTLNLGEGQDGDTLTMDIRAYVSPLANGEALVDTVPLATLTPVSVVVAAAPALSIPEATTAVGWVELPTPTATFPVMTAPAVTVDQSIPSAAGAEVDGAVAAPDVIPSPTPPALSCEGAPPIRFAVGDWVVVDFNGEGALRLMDRIDGGAAYTQVQVYDGQLVQILAGPVCGTWSEYNIWHWYVDREGKRGWVGEGTTEDPWLCPLDNPECAG